MHRLTVLIFLSVTPVFAESPTTKTKEVKEAKYRITVKSSSAEDTLTDFQRQILVHVRSRFDEWQQTMDKRPYSKPNIGNWLLTLSQPDPSDQNNIKVTAHRLDENAPDLVYTHPLHHDHSKNTTVVPMTLEIFACVQGIIVKFQGYTYGEFIAKFPNPLHL
jgi:hypothetical protein